MLRARQPPTRLVWLRLRYRLTWQLSPDMTSSVRLSFFLHSSCCLVRSFSYTPRVMLFWWGVSLTLLELVLLRSFSYTPRAGLYWGASLTDTPRAGFTEELLLHSSSWFYWGASLTLLELVLLRRFSYTPRAGLVRTRQFFLHSSSWSKWGVSYTVLLVMSSSYTPDTNFSEESLLRCSCYF